MSDNSNLVSIINKANGNTIEFSGEYGDYVFKKTCVPMPLFMEATVDSSDLLLEDGLKYNLNNYRFRGPDYKSDVDILTAGCSFTYGIGVQLEGTWPDLLATKTGQTYANISMPGAGIPWIVDSIFRYIETFGAPRSGIVALMPDITRADIIIDYSNLISEDFSPRDFVPQYHDSEYGDKNSVISIHNQGFSAARYSKKPYLVEDTYLLEEAVRRSISKLRELERYCQAASIPLVWGSWSDATILLVRQLVNDDQMFLNFHEMDDALASWKSHRHELDDPEGIIDYKIEHDPSRMDEYGCSYEKAMITNDCVCFIDCHFDLADRYGDTFHLGLDRVVNPGNAHYGVHRYIHIAASFHDKMKKAGFYGI